MRSGNASVRIMTHIFPLHARVHKKVYHMRIPESITTKDI